MTTRAAAAAVLLALTAIVACASSVFQRAASAGRTDEMIRAFEADPSLWKDDDALFQVGLAYALPGSPRYDPTAARGYFERLTRLHPASDRSTEARRLDILLAEIQRLGGAADQRQDSLQRLSAHVDSLDGRIGEQRQLVSQLQGEIRRRDAQIKALQDELERLKAIDLRLHRPR
ncbi:MAG TPA: hypothetical protein VFQ38_22775 [Longimicrobiales bacterium]|nr:hypothetical protein [Longimicrobiales bacterium]